MVLTESRGASPSPVFMLCWKIIWLTPEKYRWPLRKALRKGKRRGQHLTPLCGILQKSGLADCFCLFVNQKTQLLFKLKKFHFARKTSKGAFSYQSRMQGWHPAGAKLVQATCATLFQVRNFSFRSCRMWIWNEAPRRSSPGDVYKTHELRH